MLDIILERLRQKKRTVPYPKELPTLPPLFRGRPFIHANRCLGAKGEFCTLCASVCPTQAISFNDTSPIINLGMCTFCGNCATACKNKGIVFSKDWRLASTSLAALNIIPKILAEEYWASTGEKLSENLSLEEEHKAYLALPPFPVLKTAKLKNAFKYSLRLRQVSAGGCNACEADLNVLPPLFLTLHALL